LRFSNSYWNPLHFAPCWIHHKKFDAPPALAIIGLKTPWAAKAISAIAHWPASTEGLDAGQVLLDLTFC
jgi:hypothetical protein